MKIEVGERRRYGQPERQKKKSTVMTEDVLDETRYLTALSCPQGYCVHYQLSQIVLSLFLEMLTVI